MASAEKSRFGSMNIAEIRQKESELKNINSLKNEKKSVEAFKAYLVQIGQEDTDFFNFTEQELDMHLATFWWNARTKKGEKYKTSSLETIRHGIKRALQSFGHEFDITDPKSASFQESIKSFRNVMKQLKKEGKGYVEHRTEIKPTGKAKSVLFRILT